MSGLNQQFTKLSNLNRFREFESHRLRKNLTNKDYLTAMKDLNEKFKEEWIKVQLRNQRALENQKFGEFILQANNIQFYLSKLVILRSSFPDKEYLDKIESGTLGQIINLFCACAKKDTGEYVLIPKLRSHNKIRNKFAHKVLITTMPTNEELKRSITLGNEILKELILVVGNELQAKK